MKNGPCPQCPESNGGAVKASSVAMGLLQKYLLARQDCRSPRFHAVRSGIGWKADQSRWINDIAGLRERGCSQRIRSRAADAARRGA